VFLSYQFPLLLSIAKIKRPSIFRVTELSVVKIQLNRILPYWIWRFTISGSELPKKQRYWQSPTQQQWQLPRRQMSMNSVSFRPTFSTNLSHVSSTVESASLIRIQKLSNWNSIACNDPITDYSSKLNPNFRQSNSNNATRHASTPTDYPKQTVITHQNHQSKEIGTLTEATYAATKKKQFMQRLCSTKKLPNSRIDEHIRNLKEL